MFYRGTARLCCCLIIFFILFSGSQNAHTADYDHWTLRQKVSQLFILGFRNLSEVKDLQPGGVVLFSWNLPNVETAKELTQNLVSLGARDLRAPLFIATDHEGGQVLRLKRGISRFPDALTVGALKDPYQAFRFAKLMGHELSLLGINMNLAPVLDIGNAKSFLANRVWGENPHEVARSTIGFIDGSLSAGVIPVAKHFPGHGIMATDSHFSLPKIQKSLSKVWVEDLEPFKKAISHGIPALMTAHVLIPEIDRKPASLSRRFIQEILRDQIGYDGLVISDDLEMAAVTRSSHVSVGELSIQALKAGTDMVMIVWTKEQQKKAIEAVMKAVEDGRLSLGSIHQKLDRILRIKSKYLNIQTHNPYWASGFKSLETEHLIEDISYRALSWLTPNRDEVSTKLKRKWNQPWRVFVPDQNSRKVWKNFRTQDQVSILARRPDAQDILKFRNDLNSSLSKKTPVVTMTGPRALASEELFGELRSLLNKKIKSNQDHWEAPVLWVHQGSRPVFLEPHFKQSLKDLGIVTLHGSGVTNTTALTNHLKLLCEQVNLVENKEPL